MIGGFRLYPSQFNPTSSTAASALPRHMAYRVESGPGNSSPVAFGNADQFFFNEDESKPVSCVLCFGALVNISVFPVIDPMLTYSQ